MRKISDDKLRHIRTLLEKGLGQAEIAKIVGVSVGKVNAIAKETKASAPPTPPTESVPELSEASLEGADMSTVDKYIALVDKAVKAAEAKGDFPSMASLMTKLVALLEHKRKAAPPPPPDPNANPDMIEAARRARERLHHLIKTA
jgi:DNA-binding XRE family transcriptional regulator